MRNVTLGRLEATLAGGPDREGGGDGPAVVLLHGYGAPGTDLVGLWRVLDVPREVRFVFPKAPIVLGELGGGLDSRAWWNLDLARLERALARGEARDLSGDAPPGLADAHERVVEMLDALHSDHGVPPDRTILGGFSQGAMLSTDVVLRRERPFAGLVVLSGTLLSRSEWTPRMPARAGLPVLVSHGRADPLLPFGAAEALHGLFREAGMDSEFHAFHGQHEIPGQVLDALGAFLRRNVGRGKSAP